jgi:hypothetical protein
MRSIVFFFIFLFSFNSFSQTLYRVGQVLKRKPYQWVEEKGRWEKEFLEPNKGRDVQLYGDISSNEVEEKDIWCAVASRSGIPFFKDASCKVEEGKLTMFEQYAIVSIRGSQTYSQAVLELGEFKRFGISFEGTGANAIKVSDPCERRGFVKASDMILWNYALKDDNGYYKKMLAVRDLMAKQPAFGSKPAASKEAIPLYDGPDLQTKSNRVLPQLEFIFVWKVEYNAGRKVLLVGGNESFDKGPTTTLYGWIDENQLQPWNGRMCYEPNDNPESVSERLSKKYKFSVELEAAQAKGMKLSFNDPGNKEENKNCSYRWPAARKRPVLIGKETPDGPTPVAFLYNPEMDLDQTAEAAIAKGKEIEGALANLRKINLVLLIDGSSATKQFAEQVSSSFQKLVELLEGGGTEGFQYSLGAVVYRDDVPGNTPIFKTPVTKNTNQFLKDISSINFESKDDDFSKQNLYTGILEASKMFIGKESEQNFILAMGAGGDGTGDMGNSQLSEIKKNFVKFNIGVFANQFYRGEEIGYGLFTAQFREIAESALTELQKSRPGLALPRYSPCGAFTTCLPFPRCLLASVLFAPLPNTVITPQQFSSSILRTFEIVQKKLKEGIADFLAQKDGLKLEGLGIATKICEDCKCCDQEAAKNSFLVKGTLDLNKAGLSSDPFMKVLLLTDSERSSFIYFLNNLVNNSNVSPTELKDRVFNVFKEYLATCTGQSENSPFVRQQMETQGGVSFIMKYVGYMPKSSYLKKLTKLSDIKDPNKEASSINEIKSFIADARAVHDNLRNAKRLSCSQFVSLQSKYFWVPVELLL